MKADWFSSINLWLIGNVDAPMMMMSITNVLSRIKSLSFCHWGLFAYHIME